MPPPPVPEPELPAVSEPELPPVPLPASPAASVPASPPAPVAAVPPVPHSFLARRLVTREAPTPVTEVPMRCRMSFEPARARLEALCGGARTATDQDLQCGAGPLARRSADSRKKPSAADEQQRMFCRGAVVVASDDAVIALSSGARALISMTQLGSIPLRHRTYFNYAGAPSRPKTTSACSR